MSAPELMVIPSGVQLEASGGTVSLTIRGGNPLVIHGTINCEIDTDGPVLVGQSGVVRALNVECSDLLVSGYMECQSIRSAGLFFAERTAQVEAITVSFSQVEQRRGSRVRGDMRALAGQGAAEIISPDMEQQLWALDVASGVQRVVQAAAPASRLASVNESEVPPPVQDAVVSQGPAVTAADLQATPRGPAPLEGLAEVEFGARMRSAG